MKKEKALKTFKILIKETNMVTCWAEAETKEQAEEQSENWYGDKEELRDSEVVKITEVKD